MYYLNEHVSCKYYSYTVENGFVNHSMSQFERFEKHNTLSDNLVFVSRGHFSLVVDSREPIHLTAGDFFYLPAGVHLECEALEQVDCLVLSCATYDLYERLVEMRYTRGPALKIVADECLRPYKLVPHLQSFVNSTWEYLAKGVKCKHLQDAKMNEVLVLLNMYYSDSELYKLFHSVISTCDHAQFRSQVLKNANQSRSATELADRCGFGVRQFERKFKDIFESSPYQWMLEQKKRNLLDKLIDEELPLKHIVLDFEFCSVSHLNEFCKRYYGNTSAEIRKKNTV